MSAPRSPLQDRAASLYDEGRLEAALDVLQRGLTGDASCHAHRDFAEYLVRAGRLEEGFEHYEFRWLVEPLRSARPTSNAPGWRGQDLRGRRILLRFEQGIGDNFQYLRYASRLRHLGARTRIGRFCGIEEAIEGVDEIIEGPSLDHHYYIDTASLPRVFGTSLTTIPADVPYIEAKAQWVGRWARRVDGRAGLKVGLVWAGNPSHTNDANRSLNLLQLLPLLGVKGVTFFALQKGARSEQAVEYAGDNWVNLGPEINDFTDTAGIIEGLDLVICVDTSVAHLAGAMAKPVWLLLPKPSDFRWMEDREDSPWYPTMRLFRQKARGDWKEVIARLKAALEQQAKEGAPAPWTRKPSVPLQVAYPTQWIAGVTKLPGHRPGLSAVAETRMGMVQYLPDEPVVGDAIAWYGEYLQALVDFLSTQVAAGSTVMEVEAGIGLHALALSRMVGPQGHVMLYESDAVKKQILEQNLEVHGVRNATLMRRRIGGVPEAEPVAGEPDGVPQHETLDDLQVERLDWLKVNGGRRALEVLAGGEETIWRLRPRLLVATTGVENDEALVAELQQRLLDLGYVYSDCAITAIVTDNFMGRSIEWNDDHLAAMFVAVPEEVPDMSALAATKKFGAQSG